MFGSSKPFGTASTFGTSTFGNTSMPFGQSTMSFGTKPATNNVFGGSAFGMSQQNTSMSGGLFGSNTPTTSTGLFGQPSTAFGAASSTGNTGFGFGATSTAGGLFGGSTPSTQSSGGLFGNTNSAFGTPRLGFGSFGAANTTGTGLFGQSTSTGTGLFGASSNFVTSTPPGTTVKFNPPTGTDTMMKGGVSTSIGTRHQCITCMKEYENKSLEELRMEDYNENRKGGSAAGMGFGTPSQQPGGMFGTPTAASTSAFSFGATTQSKPLFGTSGSTNAFGQSGSGLFGQPAQNQNTNLFGKPVGGFGTPATSAAPVFNFGTSTGTSLFGQNNQQKPMFGQAAGNTSLFGSTATTQSTGFGSTGFGGFGATNQQSGGLFGAKPTGFGAPSTTTSNSFSFGTTNTLGTNSLFGQKPAASAFGTSSGFGNQTSSFGSFGTTAATGTGLFGQTKPAASTFGTSGSMFGGAIGSGFGASSYSLGLGSSTGTGLFGSTNANKAPGFNFGNTGSTGFNFGPVGSSFSGFGSSQPAPTGDLNALYAIQQAQQQILAMTVNPYGDSPLFRNPITEVSRESELLRPTNPSAQKALLNDNQYKVSPLPTAKIKPKPWSPSLSGKMLLFDGLEDEEPSLAAFVPKKSIKKLVLKNLGSSSLNFSTSISPPSQSSRIDISICLNKNAGDVSQSIAESPQETSNSPLTVSIADSNISINDERSENLHKSKPADLDRLSEDASNLNNSLDDSIVALHTKKPGYSGKTYSIRNKNDTSWQDSSNSDLASSGDVTSTNPELDADTSVTNPTGIILTRSSYYTRPTLDEMTHFVENSSNCPVKDFCVGREGYGEVIFPGITNVAGLNLDEIVEFGKKEINIYPDDNKKPPVGQGLNRKARVTLRNVWPTDKAKHCSIMDPEQISKMGYREKIERSTTQLGAKFIDYIVESGSWVFEVEHFSKYGLEDSDEEMDTQPSSKELQKKSVAAPKKNVN